MAYPIKEAKYAGEDRAAKLCRAEGGGVTDSDLADADKYMRSRPDAARDYPTETPAQKYVNDSLASGAVKVARGMNAVSRATGLPYNKGALSVQQNDDMSKAEDVSDTVPRKKE